MSSTEAVPPSPALLIITSIRPKCPAAPSTSAATCASSVTSQPSDQTLSPCPAASSSRAAASRLWCWSLIATRAPSSRQRRAAAPPMPVPAAAVTTTTLPSSKPWPFMAALVMTGAGPGRGQEALLLVRRAERDQGRAEQFLAHDRDPGRRAGPRVLLVEDDLPGQGGAAAAVFGGPAQAGPARGGQVPVPGESLVVPLVLAARPARAAQAGELAGQAGFQPRAHLGAELLVLRREPHLGHLLRSGTTYQALACLVRGRRAGLEGAGGEGRKGRVGGAVELTVPAAVAWAAREFGDAEAVAEPGGIRLSFRELDERAAAVTGALIDAGIGPGDRVAIWAPNGSEWLFTALGT